MGVNERRSAVAALQAVRNRPLITYATSHRANLPTAVAPDSFGLFYEHLHRLNPSGEKLPELDLLVLTYGGDTTVPLPLQYLLREYTERVNILVPGECFSAGTMIALGGNTLVMSPLGQLTPVDPSVAPTDSRPSEGST